MGNNSVFDDLGIGASDLGLAPDIDDLNAEINAQPGPADIPTEGIDPNDPASESAAERARRQARGRSATILTGGQGVQDEDQTTISRRTLLGS